MHAECFHVGALKYLAVDTVLLRNFFCSFAKVGRRADVAGKIAQVLGQCHAAGDCQALGQRFFSGSQFVAALHGEGKLAQWATNFVFLALEVVEAVNRFLGDDCCLADAPGNTAFFYGRFGEKQCAVKGACFVKRLYGTAN